MTTENETLRHAAEWLRYQRSKAYQLDMLRDKARRAAIDKKLGHVPACSLTRCAPGCTSTVRNIKL